MTSAGDQAPDKIRWARAHGYSESSSASRKRRGGKLTYANFWRAAIVATQLNLNDPEHPEWVMPYECRWADHWAHGETAPLHWHIGRPRHNGDRLL
jgi:hypothetical protein